MIVCQRAQHKGKTKVIINKTSYELLDVGTYGAQVESVEVADGQFGPQVKIRFALDGSTAVLTGWASQKLCDKSKLGKWTRALTGSIPDQLDIDSLAGLRCQLAVVIETKDDGAQYNKIYDVLPPKAKAKPKPAQADVCSVCGVEVEFYTKDGVPRCFAHAKEAEPENIPF